MTLKTSDLCDACAEAQACALPFVGFGRRRAFSGDIRTVRYRDGFAAARDMLQQPGAGQVLVIDGAGLARGALFGDRLAEVAVRNGWAGIVVNGLIRDRADIDNMDIGVKALGTLPARANIHGAADRDVAVVFGGVTFAPGLRLVADEDGVIVLPPGTTEHTIDVAAALAATSAYVSGQSAA